MKIRLLTLLLFYPLSSFALMKEGPSGGGSRSVKNVNSSEPKYFDSPNHILCHSPSLVVFRDEDSSPALDKEKHPQYL